MILIKGIFEKLGCSFSLLFRMSLCRGSKNDVDSNKIFNKILYPGSNVIPRKQVTTVLGLKAKTMVKKHV